MTDVNKVAESVVKIADNALALDKALITLCESLVNKVTDQEQKIAVLQGQVKGILEFLITSRD